MAPIASLDSLKGAPVAMAKSTAKTAKKPAAKKTTAKKPAATRRKAA